MSENRLETTAPKPSASQKAGASCTLGASGCGGPGVCPGIALLIAYVAGIGVTQLTGLSWLGWVVGMPLALILITGAWRFLPSRKAKP